METGSDDMTMQINDNLLQSGMIPLLVDETHGKMVDTDPLSKSNDDAELVCDSHVFFSPIKPAKEAGGKSSLILAELLTKRSPTSICHFEVPDASSMLEMTLSRKERSASVPKFSCFDLDDSGEMWLDLESAENSSLAFSIRSGECDQTTCSSVGKPTTPQWQVLEKPIHFSTSRNRSMKTLESGDTSPRKPRRTISPKLRQLATFDGIPHNPGIPHEITCVPPDAAPTKPSRRKSGDGLHREFWKQTCPHALSLRGAISLVQRSDESRSDEDQHEFSIASPDASPTKPSRKKSNGAMEQALRKKNYPTSSEEMMSLQAALAMTIYDEKIDIDVAPMHSFSLCPSADSALPPTMPTRKYSIGNDFDTKFRSPSKG